MNLTEAQLALRDKMIEEAAEKEGRSIFKMRKFALVRKGKKGQSCWNGAARRDKVPYKR